MQDPLPLVRAAAVIVPFAGVLSESGRAALRELQLPHLRAVLAASPAPQHAAGAAADRAATDAEFDASSPELSLSPPHERALAVALGLTAGDGQVPLAALLARAASWPVEGRAWGRLTPAHWQLGTEQVSMLDPAALRLDEATAQALLEAVRPLFETEGFELRALNAGCWLVAHPTLEGLPCASLDRVVGRNVDLWLGADPRLRLVRRLQNEVQMLLYRHPVNEDREARGELPVNSFWLDGCGQLPAPDAGRALPRLVLGDGGVATAVPAAPRGSAAGAGTAGSGDAAMVALDDSLRAAALAEDWHAWSRAFGRLDDGLFARCAERARAGEAVELTLCGERHALTLRPGRPGWLQRLRAVWRPADPVACLEAL